MSDCVFCCEIETRNFIVNNEKFGSRIIFETDDFVVFPALGQIVEGYLLIVSKEHYISSCAFPDSLFSKLPFVKAKVKTVLSDYYKSPLFFEHGATSLANKGGCCIDHAHIHAVPVELNLLEELAKSFSYRAIDDYYELKKYYGKDLSYFYIENGLGDKYLFDVPYQIPSQYIRKIIANKIGKPDKWDWRFHYGLEALFKTLDKLSDKF